MAVIAPDRTIGLPAERNLAELSKDDQDLHWALMALLGYEGGAATVDGGLSDKVERLAIAQQAAQNARISLPATAEIAECNECGLIFNADHAKEAEGLTLCGEHAHAWSLANDENYGRDDTTFESRWD
ncbi:hypothetical protein HUT19_41415 (plasmid) [Streptomyces sp. NA02950]|uniref:hypothetical protein n=1 Tax=Streptomyces sp. NA02950 TaxID=2742137 RepID=UPI00159244E7|nr:hypothetical protein [Streptomyces sp. NA02950]QKV98183.1 hypothetical protein HUT19_41415 [Streptomyces sp. NA02950]